MTAISPRGVVGGLDDPGATSASAGQSGLTRPGPAARRGVASGARGRQGRGRTAPGGGRSGPGRASRTSQPRARTSGGARALELLDADRSVAWCGACLMAQVRLSHVGGLMRKLREAGWDIARSRAWCGSCLETKQHYQLVGRRAPRQRTALPRRQHNLVLDLSGGRDAYSMLKSGRLEVDHRVPHAEGDGSVQNFEDGALSEHFQALSHANNEMKNAVCQSCRTTGTRSAFMGIDFWLEGSAARPDDCTQCPYAYPERWRDELARRIAAD